jgi:hypothetical protein
LAIEPSNRSMSLAGWTGLTGPEAHPPAFFCFLTTFRYPLTGHDRCAMIVSVAGTLPRGKERRLEETSMLITTAPPGEAVTTSALRAMQALRERQILRAMTRGSRLEMVLPS